ncbi:GtrA family protein [Devosia sp. 1566]|uniref:GtrA family protein n=1 Tax=Devosia sp. 1566 TaxID=2499144 RepID=UPI000FD704BF|nr:GtrA family protein [Devosia sp. 1566]
MAISTSPAGTAPAARGSKLVRFVAVSGVGWLLDTGVYTVLVMLGARVFWAGLVGGLCGASFSFLVSSRYVFAHEGGGLSRKLIVYLVYSIGMILAGAAAAEVVTSALVGLAGAQKMNYALTLLAFAAKCAITPFLLATNFFVARFIMQRS